MPKNYLKTQQTITQNKIASSQKTNLLFGYSENEVLFQKLLFLSEWMLTVF